MENEINVGKNVYILITKHNRRTLYVIIAFVNVFYVFKVFIINNVSELLQYFIRTAFMSLKFTMYFENIVKVFLYFDWLR